MEDGDTEGLECALKWNIIHRHTCSNTHKRKKVHQVASVLRGMMMMTTTAVAEVVVCLCYVADLFAVYLTDSLFGGCVYIAFHANANVCLFINWPLKTGGNV